MSKKNRRVLVHSSNGAQGSAIARRLVEEGFDVRGSVRDLEKAGPLRARGIDVVAADLEDVAALIVANQDVDAVVLTLPIEWNSDTLLRWTGNALSAARECGVGLVVLNNSTRIPVDRSDVSSFEMRRAVEAMLWRSGLPAIALRPPLFMENLKNPTIVQGITQHRIVAYPTPDRYRISWLAMTDLGAYIAAALRRPDLAGETIQIGGPEALNGPALASALSEALATPIQYASIPPDIFERAISAQFPPSVARGIAQTYHYCAQNPDSTLLTGTDSALTSTLSRPRLTLAQWARAQEWRG